MGSEDTLVMLMSMEMVTVKELSAHELKFWGPFNQGLDIVLKNIERIILG